MARVVIGVDPHKRSATIEVINEQERTVGQGRYGTDRDGYQAMLAAGRKHKDRQWAVEGCNGIGRHVAQRLVADGDTVLDVAPAENLIRPGEDRCTGCPDSTPTLASRVLTHLVIATA